MKRTAATLIVCLTFAFAVTEIFAQGERDTNNSPDQALRSNARVNPSTLAMEMSIPLGAYRGRAGNSLSNTLSYSSKVWQLREYGAVVNGSGSQGISVVPFYAFGSAAGWTSGLAAPRIDVKAGSDIPYYMTYGCSYDGSVWSNIDYGESCNFDIKYMKRLYVVMPDGSSHEFRASDTPITCGSKGAPCNDEDFTGIYLSVDGSRMRLEFGSSSSTLFMPTGGRILFDSSGIATDIVDVHGNRSEYDSTNKEWTDTMGRVLPNPLPPNLTVGGYLNDHQEQTVGNQTVSLPGLGSETLDTTLSWRYLKHPTSSDPDDSALGNTSLDLAYPTDFYCEGSSYDTFSGTKLFTNTNAANVRLCNYGTTSPGPAFNPVVLTKITLANGQIFKFEYNLYGEIEKIIYPAGGYERFVYAEIPAVQALDGPYDQTNRGVTDRYVSVKGDGSDELHWEYGVTRGTTLSPAPYVVTTTNPDGTSIEQYLHDEPDLDVIRPYGFDDAKTGRPYDERSYSSDSTPALMSRKLTIYDVTGPLSGGYSSATRDVRPSKEISIVFEPGETNALATLTESIYDTSGNSDPAYFSATNVKEVKQYKYVVVSASTAASASPTTAAGWFSGSDLARTTETDYLYDSNYEARNIVGLITEVRVKDASGNLKAKSQMSYDESGYALTSSGTMPSAASASWIDPTDSGEFGGTIGSKRGMPTTSKNYFDVANSYYVETHSFFDQYGNLRKGREGRGNDTTSVYDDDYAFAYPTSVTTPVPDSNGTYGSDTAFTTSVSYDYNTGLPLTTTDANGVVTAMEYDDPLLRPTKATTAVGTALEAETNTEYGAGTSASTRWVKVRSQIDSGNWKEAYTWYDGLGRTMRTQSVDDDGDVFALTCYDDMGRVSNASNPFRGWTTQSCSTANGTSGIYWTSNTFDTAGRPWKVTTPDGAVVETTYGLATSGSQIGMVVTVEDQADKQRRSITNALGQLIRVDEPDNSSTTGSLGSLSSPNQPTLYTYDTLNNLIGVQQDGDTTAECGGVSSCSQTRSFTYDALSRLKSATNPESGTISYTYDNNSNLATKTDARGIVTTYTYDTLNRVTDRSYTAPSPTPANYQTTPSVSYYYDNLTNAKGKLIKVSSSVSTTEYTSFDILGRVTASKQTTDGVTYGNGSTDSAMTYTYNLAGALMEQQYPSGRKVQNTLDASGDLEMVRARKNATSGYWAYANNFSYNAAGAVTSMQFGNGLWESTLFNSRLQPEHIYLGTTTSGTLAYDKLQLDYGYGTTSNNGNVLTQTITVQTVGSNTGFSAVQTYNYDSLNRLKDATESLTPTGGSATETWKQTFTFDRYGNRNFDEANTTTLTRTCGTSPSFTICTADRKRENPAIEPDSNKIKLDQDGDTVNDYLFDSGGNTTKDADSRTFIYDAENKQVEVKNASSQTIGKYWYDGDGKRVKKEVPSTGEVTIFVYDAAGKLVAEYSTVVADTNDAKVAYLTNDHLGSPRVNTDKNGNVKARHDYHPFGEEIASSQRTSGLGYADDTVRKQFTAYERDNETDLDFAQARYYSKNLGRFMSPDPLYLELRRLGDPQRINIYSYTRNSPLRFTDSTGLDVTFKCDSTKNCEQARDDLNNRNGNQFKVALGKGNVLKVVGKVDVKKLSKPEAALYKAITDTKNHATLEVKSQIVNENGAPQTDFAVNVGKGVNAVDLENTSKLNAESNKGGLNAGDVIAHESLEAYYTLSMDLKAAHQAVLDAGFPGLDFPTNNYNHMYRVQGEGDFMDFSRFSQGISDGRGSEQIKITYQSPIPFESVDPRFVNQQDRNEVIRDTGGRVTEVNYVPKKPNN